MGGISPNHHIEWLQPHRICDHRFWRGICGPIWKLFASDCQNSQSKWRWLGSDQRCWWNLDGGWCWCMPRQLVAPFSVQSSGCESEWTFSQPVHEHVSVRAYLETLLSYGPAAKESYLTAAMWYKDTAKHMEDHQLNKGFKSRQEWSLGSNKSSWSADLISTCVSRIAWCWTE